MTDRETREHEHLLTLDAPPEAVWKAITDADELTRWFPITAEVEPGEGGKITFGWAPDIVGACRIDGWEPERHLRTSWTDPGDDPARARVAVDWYLEGEGGRTVLRLVHSGFGRGADWDDEFEGTRRGWSYELGCLKHYLERHAGRPRHAFWVRQATGLDRCEVWNRMTREGALLRGGGLDGLAPGDRFAVELAGQPIAGVAQRVVAPVELSATVESLNDGMMRFGFEDCGAGKEAHIWLSTWGVPAAEVAEIETKWGAALRRVFA